MFDKFRIILGMGFFGAMFGFFVGPYFGYQQMIGRHQECYIRTEYDNTFEWCTAGLGMAAGVVMVLRDRTKGKSDDSERN